MTYRAVIIFQKAAESSLDYITLLYTEKRGVIICNRLCIALSSERYKRGLLGGQYLWQTLAFANPQKPPNTLYIYILGQ